ncbi:hypothetical protein KB553_22560 [Chryseobacterium rhizoplanae]|uniref:Uncharacterized protein n=1 Tax=Chryseobacterium bernardetii TaxID=1241978 RepID=A0A3G6TC73_9FLAO|nr:MULTISPECIES: hypothetical protein [Chryseobacterium]AZB25527.1 hypothetical protein EG339_13510 [Chryseobacterium bernardetii]UCA59753.1 hypothetical protein KB553_22560 [Chryseobacterium rhizoplanae]
MKYLPFERIIFNTNLPEQEVMTRLLDFVEPKKFFSWKHIKDYEGSVDTNSFDISRVIKYRNSFLPQISGSIQKNNYGTQIQVTMKLHIFTFFFLIVWCLMASSFFMMILIKEIEDQKITGFFLIPLIMLLFMYGMTMAGFKIESKKSKEYLRKAFEAEIRIE